MLAQIGAFALPALLSTYMDRWHLSATEAGWLIGIFFATYVVAERAVRAALGVIDAHHADCWHHAPHGRCWSKAAFDQTDAVRDLVLRFADVLG